MPRKIDTYRKLRALMLENGYDQTTLGRRCGLSRTQVSDRMVDKTPWTLDEVYRVCDALCIEAKDIKQYFPPRGAA
mgnify:FL=1|nr:MAG TPA: Helix-turn-helix XRE-family like protein [Caudoviricetes sp.]